MFFLNTKKHFLLFTVRVTEHWHRLPGEAVESTLRDIQKPSGHSPGQPVLSNPAAADKLDKVTS